MPIHDVPSQLPADPIRAAEWLRSFHGQLMASMPSTFRDSDSMRAVWSNRIGWQPPVTRGPNPYASTGSAAPTPPSSFRPDDGWHASTPQTSSDLVGVCVQLHDAIGTLSAVASDTTAQQRNSAAAQRRVEQLGALLSSLSAEIPASSRPWLEPLAATATHTPTTPSVPPRVPLKPR